MSFNRRKMVDDRKAKANAELAHGRDIDSQVLGDAARLIVTWNDPQAWRMPMLFSPTVGAAIAAREIAEIRLA